MKNPQGNLTDTSFPALLQEIFADADPCGVLDVIREPVKKRFFFKDGRPVSSTSNVLGEVLGRLLMEEGVITQSDYETSLEKVIGEKKRHGEVLISMGLITAEKLDEFLALQLKRRLLNIFGWEEGTFRYTRVESLPESLQPMPMNTGRLILEGISLGFYPPEKAKEDLQEHLPRPMILNEAALARHPIAEFGLNLQEQRFLKSFDGTRALGDALETSDLLKHRALAVTLSAIITGIIRWTEEPAEEDRERAGTGEAMVGDAAPETRMGAELRFMRARSALLDGEYGRAVDLLEQITEMNPTEGEYWAYLGWAIYKQNPSRAEEAEKILKDAIDLNNDLDRAWYYLGMVFLAKGDAAWAEKAFSTSVEKNPWMLEALSELKRIEIKRSAAELADLLAAEHRAWMTRYGFSEDPFTPLPEEKYHIPVAAQTQAVEELTRDIKKKSNPLMLEGGPGAGKTTVILELLNALSNEKVLASVVLRPPARELDLMKAVNTAAGVPADSRSVKELLFNLGMRLSQNKIQGGHSVIIIDDAHTLSPGCLKLIQYLSRLKTLQLVLVAEPRLAERLEDPIFAELGEKLSTRHVLGGLTPEETQEYVITRLNRADRIEEGSRKFFNIDDDALEGLFERSGGVPALINRNASELLAGDSGIATVESATLDQPSFDEGAYVETGLTGNAPFGAGTDTDASTGEGMPEAAAPPALPDFELDDLEASGPDLKAEEEGGAVGSDEDFDLGFGPAGDFGPGSEGEDSHSSFDEGPDETPADFETPAASAPEPAPRAEEPDTDTVLPVFSDQIDLGGAEPEEARPTASVRTIGPARTHSPARTAASAAAATAAARATVPAPAPEEEAEAPEADADKKKTRRKGGARGLLRLLVWVIVMLVAGLVIGTAIGVIIHGPVELANKFGVTTPGTQNTPAPPNGP